MSMRLSISQILDKKWNQQCSLEVKCHHFPSWVDIHGFTYLPLKDIIEMTDIKGHY